MRTIHLVSGEDILLKQPMEVNLGPGGLES